MITKYLFIAMLALSAGAYAYAEELTPVNELLVLDTKPVDGKKCQVRNNTGVSDKGQQCQCTDDPDGDPYLVWVCK